jgi:hypothetical protein
MVALVGKIINISIRKKKFFSIGFYFLIPMLVMVILYTLIICKIYRNNTAMRMRSFQSKLN